jgi:hypothetical protein
LIFAAGNEFNRRNGVLPHHLDMHKSIAPAVSHGETHDPNEVDAEAL